MSTSVIIPTYNGAHKILNALNGLEKQLSLPDEVLVVIDGSTDGTADMLRARQFRFPSFRIVEQQNGGRAKVRNRGAKEATGSLLIFLDDDMIVPEGWVAAHIAHHELHPGSIVTGKLEDPNAQSDNDFYKFKAWLGRKWNKDIAPKPGEDTVQPDAPYITANNFSLAAGIFRQLDGFDERLTDAEDFDMATRAQKQQLPLFISNSAWAWHNDLATPVAYVRRMRQYTRAQEVLAALKPDLYGGRHQYAAVAPGGIKGAIFTMLCSNWWINSIDKGTWKWLPENIRYRLYDAIVTANGSFFPGKVKL